MELTRSFNMLFSFVISREKTLYGTRKMEMKRTYHYITGKFNQLTATCIQQILQPVGFRPIDTTITSRYSLSILRSQVTNKVTQKLEKVTE